MLYFSTYARLWSYLDNIRGTSDLCTQFSAPPYTLKLRPSHTSAALTSPTAHSGVGIVTSQTSKESMYRHTTVGRANGLDIGACRSQFYDWNRRSTEHLSGTAEFPLTAQTYFCDSRSPLRSPLQTIFYTRSPLRSRSPDFWPAPLQLRSCSNMFQAAKWQSGPIFTARAAMLTRYYLYVCLSIRLSVCHMRVLWQNQITHCGYFDTTRNGNRPGFLAPTVLGGRRTLPSQICGQRVIHPFETHLKCLLIASQP